MKMRLTLKNDFNMESIQAVTENKTLKKMEELFTYLKTEHGMLKFQSNDDITKQKGYREKFEELEDAVFVEYGIHFKFYSTNAGPHCIVPPGPSSNIIAHQNAEISKIIKNVMRKYKIRPDNKSTDIKALKSSKDLINLYATLGQSMNEIEKQYFNKKVKIDFAKGKIEGLNKDVVVFVGIPFIQLFRANFTVREIMAITYHEFGHGFNSLAYMHQYFTTVNTAVEGMYESKNEKELIESYNNIIAIDGRNVSDVKELFYDIFNMSDKTNGNVYAIKNNESMADQFAVRHGLGQDLVTALARITGNLEGAEDNKADSHSFSLALFMTYTAIAVLIVVIIMTNPMAAMFFYILFWVIYMIFALVQLAQVSTVAGVTDPNKLRELMLDTDSIYDDLEQRFRRVKYDLIRQMKETSTKNKSDILVQISTIEELIEKVEEDRGIFTNLKYLFTMRRRQVGISDFYMSAEELMENDMHVRSETFKRIFK